MNDRSLEKDSISPVALGLISDPPTIVLAYDLFTPVAFGVGGGMKKKRRKRKMPLRDFTDKSNVKRYAFNLRQRHSKYLTNVIDVTLEKMLRIIQEIQKGHSVEESLEIVEKEYSIDPEEDLNILSPAQLAQRKAVMDEMFMKNLIRPGDPEFVYDKEVSFETVPKDEEGNDWDEDEELGAGKNESDADDKEKADSPQPETGERDKPEEEEFDLPKKEEYEEGRKQEGIGDGFAEREDVGFEEQKNECSDHDKHNEEGEVEVHSDNREDKKIDDFKPFEKTEVNRADEALKSSNKIGENVLEKFSSLEIKGQEGEGPENILSSTSAKKKRESFLLSKSTGDEIKESNNDDTPFFGENRSEREKDFDVLNANEDLVISLDDVMDELSASEEEDENEQSNKGKEQSSDHVDSASKYAVKIDEDEAPPVTERNNKEEPEVKISKQELLVPTEEKKEIRTEESASESQNWEQELDTDESSNGEETLDKIEGGVVDEEDEDFWRV